ncbi:MAG TPA: ABC transporter permease [Bryobacteraceae bacterium]|nr:ABC transporter permease [Bryobacteraceae bacterium]
MGLWKEIIRKASYFRGRSRFDRELEHEIQFHLQERAEELESEGRTSEEALAQARREFGPGARSREDSRAAWQVRWLEDLASDVKYAIRSLRRNRAFGITAILCLALGIGSNAMIFSLIDAILLRPLPYPNADRIVRVRFSPPNQPDQKLGTNPGSYFFIREHNDVFERMGALRITGFDVTADSGAGPASAWVLGGWASPGLTGVMGVQPRMGRWFSLKDRGFDVVISYGLWQRLFGGDPKILDRKMRVDGIRGAANIIGVAPAGFRTENPNIDFWLLQPDEDLARARRSPNRVFNLFARLKPGVSVAQAQAEMNSLAAPLGVEMEMNRGWNIAVDSLKDSYVAHLRGPLLIFEGAVLFLLLIACANVAGLLLAQATARQKELGLRAALGGSRPRVVRQLLTESVFLSLAGGLSGIAFAWLGLLLVAKKLPALLPLGTHAAMDVRVLAFSLLLAAGTGLIFGAIPALQISRPNLMGMLRESSANTTAGSARQRLRGAFVVVQVSLALVLLVGAGLLTRSLVKLNMLQPGFDPHNLITFQVPFSRTLYHGTGRTNTVAGGLEVEYYPKFYQLGEEMRQRIANLPGVESAALGMTPPLGEIPRRFNFEREGRPVSASEAEAWSAEWYPVSAGYFQTLRLPVLRGRSFLASDSATAPPVAIVNTAFAERFFPHENPLGHRMQIKMLNDQPREIVGVVEDVRQNRLAYRAQPQMYVPRDQVPPREDMTFSLDFQMGTFIVRAKQDPAILVPSLRKAVTDVFPDQAITNVLTVEQYAARQLDDLRHYAALLSLFGALSILLAIAGLSGVMAQTVSQRTNEIGIRMALGASSRSVLLLIARQAFALVATGAIVGVAISFALTRVIASFLWGVTATDPLTYALVILGMAAVAVLACYLPAQRALRIDPAIALRRE